MNLDEVVGELRALQRGREQLIKMRVQAGNQRLHIVACGLGYHAGMVKEERMQYMDEASALVESVTDNGAVHHFADKILAAQVGIDALLAEQSRLEKEMLPLAKLLPVADWIDEPEQAGISLQKLGEIIGECGDLSLYGNPGKVWKRFGCAPFTKGDKTLMGSTWKKKKQLSADEWTQAGYCPRRRAIMFIVGDNFIKQNFLTKIGRKGDKPGPYRQRYLECKARFRETHPGATLKHADNHGRLLAVKLFLKNLWIEWRRRISERGVVNENGGPGAASP